jgi:hypothetical protein
MDRNTRRQLRRMEGNLFERIGFKLFGETKIFTWILGGIVIFKLAIVYIFLHFIIKYW